MISEHPLLTNLKVTYSEVMEMPVGVRDGLMEQLTDAREADVKRINKERKKGIR